MSDMGQIAYKVAELLDEAHALNDRVAALAVRVARLEEERGKLSQAVTS